MRIVEDIYRLTIRLSLTGMNCNPAFNLYSGTHLCRFVKHVGQNSCAERCWGVIV